MGVLPKNENVSSEMVEIMSHYHQYVPMTEFNDTEVLEGSGEQINMINSVTLQCVFMWRSTNCIARARLAKNVRDNAESPSEQLEGLIPVVLDWHAKQALLGVS